MLAARVKVILLVLFAANSSSGAVGQENAASGQRSHVVDAHVYNGFRRYHAGCNHCHGPDGMGSTIGPSLVDRLPGIDAFRGIVRGGTSNGSSVMQGFASDPNVAPYIETSMRT